MKNNYRYMIIESKINIACECSRAEKRWMMKHWTSLELQGYSTFLAIRDSRITVKCVLELKAKEEERNDRKNDIWWPTVKGNLLSTIEPRPRASMRMRVGLYTCSLSWQLASLRESIATWGQNPTVPDVPVINFGWDPSSHFNSTLISLSCDYI